MGTKIIGMVIAVFMCLTICFPAAGEAVVTYTPHDATVVSVGPYGPGAATGVTVFSLTITVGTSTTTKYYKAAAGREKEMQAVAMAALINGRTIRVWKDDTASQTGASIPLAIPLYGMELK